MRYLTVKGKIFREITTDAYFGHCSECELKFLEGFVHSCGNPKLCPPRSHFKLVEHDSDEAMLARLKGELND